MIGARVFNFVNLDNVIQRMDKPPIIINQLALDTEEDRKLLESLTVTRYEATDVFSTVPMCSCRRTKVAEALGTICEHCGTEVVSHHNQAMESELWISVPDGIEYFLSPLPWIFLNQRLSARGFNGLQWAMDSKIPDPEESNKKASSIVNRFKQAGFVRGLSHLKDQFDTIVDVAIRETQSAQKRVELLNFIDYYKDALFVKHIPIPSKVAFTIENTAYGNYFDRTMTSAIEAIFSAAGTSSMRNIKRLESRFTSILVNLTAYYEDVVTNNLSSKSGWLRRVNYGTRMNYSFRNIITSYHGLHEVDTILVPYHQLLTVLEPLVVAHLIREYNHTHSQAQAYVIQHATDKDPLLWEILEMFIDETPPVPVSETAHVVTLDKGGRPVLTDLPCTLTTRKVRTGGGIRCALTRYPSLSRSSTQGVRIVGLSDCEIRISVLALRGPNADKLKYSLLH